jgi:Flp pilus assembly protein TadD
MSSDQTSSAPEPAELPPPRQEGPCDWRRLAAGVLIIFLAAFAVYWRVLRGEFLWDDLLVVHRNPLVTGELGLGSIWFRTDFPLSNVAFWLEWLAWGKHPVGYHVVNVLLHAVGAVLLWRVLARLKIPGAWLAAMIFTVHPLCVASVAWIAELKNALSLPCYLLSILWYLRFDSDLRISDFGFRPSKWYWFSLAAFALALLSKTSTVMLPVVLLGCAWWRRGRVGARDWLLASPFLVLALNFGLMSIGFQVHGAMAGVAVQSVSFWGRMAGAGMAIWFYLSIALLPLHLSMIYPKWRIDVASVWSYLPLLLWCGLLVACWRFRRGWGRHVLFGLGCFTVTLFPVLGLFDMYFLALSRVSDHFALRGRVLVLAGGILVVGLAVLAGVRAQVFTSEEVLWRDTLLKNPAAWLAHANLGWILASQQKYDEAREHLAASLKLKPDNAQAHSNLGRVLAIQGQFAAAEPEFQAAVRIKPKDAEIRRSYAAALADQGRKDEAMTQLRDLLQSKPDTEARSQLASLLYQAGKLGEAVAEYRQVVAAKPDQPETLSNLAWLLATSPDSAVRNGTDAVRFAEQACHLTGYQRPQMIGALAAAYAEAGRFTEAVAATQKAIDLARASGDARFAAVNEQLLKLYSAGKPYHMTRPSTSR